MNIYKEITNDHGCPRQCNASDNFAVYILTSALAHDLYHEFVEKYDRIPTAAWYNRHFEFERIGRTRPSEYK